jgi:dolichol kinase
LSDGVLTNGSTTASFTVTTPGTYVIQIKYNSKSIAGTTAPIPANITYSFGTSLGGNTGASVQLLKQ